MKRSIGLEKRVKNEIRSITRIGSMELDSMMLFVDDDKTNVSFELKVNTIDKLTKMNADLLKKATSTNFRGDICEQMSFIKIESDELEITISPPTYKNGDSNWTSYARGVEGNEKFITYSSVNITFKENEF